MMNDITVKLYGIAPDGTELISGADAQAIISVLSGEIKELTAERDALAAQVQSFKKAIKAIENDLIECSCDDESGYFVGIDSISDACDLANYATPQQCLAEIRAEVIQSLRFPVMLRKMWSGGDVQEWLKEQAAKVRQGGE